MSVPNEVLISAFTVAFAALAFTIRVLWSKLAADYKYLLGKSEACESDREEMHGKIFELSCKVATAINCKLSSCPNNEKKHS